MIHSASSRSSSFHFNVRVTPGRFAVQRAILAHAFTTGDALTVINDHISTIHQLVSNIEAAAADQYRGLNEVNQAVHEVELLTQQNAAMVEEATASSMTLAREAEKLRQMVARFKLPAQSNHIGTLRSTTMSAREEPFASYVQPKKIVRLRSGAGARGE